MKGLLIPTAVLVCGSGLAMEAVREDLRYFTLRYGAAAQEKYAVRWVAALDYKKHESGGPSRPFQAKWIDDRQCHWMIMTSVQRRFFLVNAQGTLFEKRDVKAADRLVAGSEAPPRNVDTLRNCNEEEGHFQSDLRAARATAEAGLSAVVQRDLAEAERIMRGWPGVQAVTRLGTLPR